MSALSDELSQVRTKKKEFLEQIERIIPWSEWIALIKPCYYKGECGNKPYDLKLMLRIYFVQNLYNLSDMATAAEVIDSRAFSDFCGVDKDGSLLHMIRAAPANRHDVTVPSEMLTGEEEQVYGDSGYLGAGKCPEAKKKNIHGKRIKYKINRRPSQSKNNSTRSKSQIKRREREKSSVRAKVEHVFAVVKLQLRFRKTRYRGLPKQAAKLNMVFALANLILADRPCPAA